MIRSVNPQALGFYDKAISEATGNETLVQDRNMSPSKHMVPKKTVTINEI